VFDHPFLDALGERVGVVEVALPENQDAPAGAAK